MIKPSLDLNHNEQKGKNMVTFEKIKSNKLEKVYKYMDVSKSLDLLK